MKPAPFDYHAPTTVAAAIALLQRLPNARALAGGQSLVPMLNLRAVMPDHLIDLNNIISLRGIRETGRGLAIGAMTTQREIERSALVRRHCPLLGETVDHVGHQQTRNRGTLGGSLCHLDPGAELPVAAAVLDAVLTAEGPNGSAPSDSPIFPPVISRIRSNPTRSSPESKFRRRHPARAMRLSSSTSDRRTLPWCQSACISTLHDGRIAALSVAVGGIGYAPIRLAEAEQALRGMPFDDRAITTVKSIAAQTPCEGDEVSPPDFRQKLCGVLAGRALKIAAERTKGAADALPSPCQNHRQRYSL